MTTWYVDSVSGNDSTGSGTLAAPWRTSGKVIGSAVSGDSIVFRGGATVGAPKTYTGFWTNKSVTLLNHPDEHVNISDTSRTQVIAWSMCTSGGITVQGTGSFRVGDATPPASTSDTTISATAMQLAGCTGMVFDGGAGKALKFESFGDFGIRTAAEGSTQTRNCTFRNLESLHNAVGIRVGGEGTNTVAPTGGSGVLIEGCLLHDNNRMAKRSSGGSDDFGALGVDLYKCTGVTIRNCDLYNNFSTVAASGDPPSYDYGVDGGAFETYGSTWCLMTGNRIRDNEGIWEMGTDTGSPVPTGNAFRYNVCYGTIDPLPAYSGSDSPGILARAFVWGVIEHNVFDLDGGNDVIRIDGGTSTWGAGVDNGVIRNNIIVARGTNQRCVNVQNLLPATFVLDYNLYHQPTTPGTVWQYAGYGSGTTGTLATFQGATPFEDHGLLGDPLFTDRVARDYTIGATSPAVNTGVVIAGVNDGYTGIAPEMGAFERPAPGFTGVALDTFARTTSGGWGTSDSGHAWTATASGGGTTADFTTDGSVGKHAASVSATTHNAQLGITAIRDLDVVLRVASDKLATGDAWRAAVDLRFVDTSNLYRLYVVGNSGGSAIQAKITRVLAGASTDIVPVTTLAGLAQLAGRWWRLRVQAQYTPAEGDQGEYTTLRVRIWQDGTSEPTTWFTLVEDSSAALQAAAGLRVRSELGGAWSAGAVVLSWDDILVTAIPEGVPVVDPVALDVLVYDSGWLSSNATSHVLPPGHLTTGESYRWTVEAEDTDGLTATLS